MQTYTVFCQQSDGRGTIWIDSVDATCAEEAATLGKANCAADWEYEDLADIHVLGVAAGEVDILTWEDLNVD